MLFDIKGKRRRVVQGVYLTLAILMGAGLVLFGIGSDVSGGLGDLFKDGGGSNQADKTIQKRIDASEKKLRTNPRDEAALAELTRGHYQLATAEADPQTSEFTSKARPELEEAVAAWQRYKAVAKKPEPSLGSLVVQAYAGLGQLETAEAQKNQQQPEGAKQYWEGAAEASEIIADARPNAQNYIQLVQYATLAGQTRKAELAGQKAVELAPKNQKKEAKAAVEQAKQASTTQGQGAQPVPGS